jgi:HEAT repeat protein
MNEKLNQAFEALKTFDWGVDPEVLKPIDEAIVASHSDPAARKDLEDRLIAALKSVLPQPAKGAVCRALRIIGTAAAVPALASMLADEKLSHMARYALERIPGAEACSALLAALPKSSGKIQLGIISSLGVHGESAAIAPLTGLLDNGDPLVSAAAACALGDIGTPDAAKAVTTAKPTSATQTAFADASLVCGEKLLASGEKAAAKTTYEKLVANTPTALVKAAATRGIELSSK